MKMHISDEIGDGRACFVNIPYFLRNYRLLGPRYHK